MFIPFVFTLDERPWSKNHAQGDIYYIYADACIAYNWPMIAPERYFSRFSEVEDPLFGWIPMPDFIDNTCIRKVPTAEEMLSIKAYPILQAREDSIISKYSSKSDCLNNLLTHEDIEFEQVIGELLDKIIEDSVEKPEGILCFEILPKSLISAAEKRGITVIYQLNGLLRRPLCKLRQHPRANFINCMSAVSDYTFKNVQSRYNRFLSEKADLPILSRKGILRLFVDEQYMMDIHNIDNEPEYDVGVLHQSIPALLHLSGQETMSDKEMSSRAIQKYAKVLIRARPGFQQYAETDAIDDSPSCFHFCCKCKRVLGSATKGMFEVMLAGRVAHEYGSFIFHSFCNHGIEDDSKGVAPIEFINFIIFAQWAPSPWLTDQDYLRFLLSNPSEKDLYMRSFKYFTRGISRNDLEFYYMSDNRAYRLGDPLYFTSGHLAHEYAPYYCKKGLHVPEATHIWSEGDVTEFEFDLPEFPKEDLIISVMLYAVSYNSGQKTLRCEVNGWVCGETNLPYGSRLIEFKIPQSRVSNKLNIQFFYENPQTVQWGETQKRITIAFEIIKISREGQCPFEIAMRAEINTLRVAADNLRTEVNTLQTEIIKLSDELNNIKNSRAYREIIMPVWRLSAKLTPKRRSK